MLPDTVCCMSTFEIGRNDNVLRLQRGGGAGTAMQVHASCAGSRLLPRQLAGLRCRAPHPAAGPGRRARGAQTVFARGGRGQQGRLQQSVQPAPPGWLPNPLANAPWYAGAPAVLLVAFLAVKYRKYARRLYKKVYRRIRGYNYYDDDEDDDEDDECAPQCCVQWQLKQYLSIKKKQH